MHRRWFLLGLLLAAVLLACEVNFQMGGASSEPAAPAPATGPTDTPVISAVDPVTAVVVPTDRTVTFGQSSVTIPAEWGNLNLQGFQAQFGYAVDALMNGTMSTIGITRFATSPQDEFCEYGCIDIIPVAQAQQALGRFLFPPEDQGAAVTFQTRRKTLSFQNGSGDRTLEVHGQGVETVSNRSLRYIFRGYTANGQYAVFVTFPIQATILPSDPDPAANTNPNVFAPVPPVDDPAAIDAFNRQAMTLLDTLSPSAFTPDLDWLDGLVQSIYAGP